MTEAGCGERGKSDASDSKLRVVAVVIITLAVVAGIGVAVLWYREAPDWQAAERLAHFGDYFGGLLNPLIAFLAFGALLYTIHIQREELKATREELARSVEQARAMNVTAAKQAELEIAKVYMQELTLQAMAAQLKAEQIKWEHSPAIAGNPGAASKRVAELVQEFTQKGNSVFRSKIRPILE